MNPQRRTKPIITSNRAPWRQINCGRKSGPPPESVLADDSTSKQNLQALLPAISELLLSKKSADAITEELLDYLGFDEMDLAGEVVQDRYNVGKQVRAILVCPPQQLTSCKTACCNSRGAQSESGRAAGARRWKAERQRKATSGRTPW